MVIDEPCSRARHMNEMSKNITGKTRNRLKMYILLADPCHGCHTFNASDRNLAKAHGSDSWDCKPTFQKRWYRFDGAAGTRLPTQFSRRGSEPYPVWLNVKDKRLPHKGEGVKEGITVCLPLKGSDCCENHFQISVKNCSSYLVYRLHAIKCPYRYYGTN